MSIRKVWKKCPYNYDYPWSKKAGYFGIGEDEISYDQTKWDQAREWYDAYKIGEIPFI